MSWAQHCLAFVTAFAQTVPEMELHAAVGQGLVAIGSIDDLLVSKLNGLMHWRALHLSSRNLATKHLNTYCGQVEQPS